MRFTDLLFQTLLEEVKNKALFTKLMSGWRQQKPNLTDEEGEEIFNLTVIMDTQNLTRKT